MQYLPAFLRGTYESEAAAVAATRLDPARMGGDGPLACIGGGNLYIIRDAAFVVLRTGEVQFELWTSTLEFACAEEAKAQAKVAEFTAVIGADDWRVFAWQHAASAD